MTEKTEYQRQKVALYGTDLLGMAKAAQAGLDYERVNGRPSLDVIGFRIDGKYYSVKFNKASISVWENDES